MAGRSNVRAVRVRAEERAVGRRAGGGSTRRFPLATHERAHMTSQNSAFGENERAVCVIDRINEGVGRNNESPTVRVSNSLATWRPSAVIPRFVTPEGPSERP